MVEAVVSGWNNHEENPHIAQLYQLVMTIIGDSNYGSQTISNIISTVARMGLIKLDPDDFSPPRLRTDDVSFDFSCHESLFDIEPFGYTGDENAIAQPHAVGQALTHRPAIIDGPRPTKKRKLAELQPTAFGVDVIGTTL